MRHILSAISIFFLINGCVTRKPVQEHQKTVKFTESGGKDYISPNFKRIADTTYVLSLIVRTGLAPVSEIVTEKLNETDKAALELENSLVKNDWRVIDRPVYQDLETAIENMAYPFDFIIEILEVKTTRHYTGIIFNRHNPHYLEGRKMLVKIINAKNAEIVALVNCEYVPCRNGCKIKYDDYQIIDITTLRGKDTDEGNMEKNDLYDHMISQLAAQVGEFIKLEMYRYKRNLPPK